ncbi:hypothetical protein [Lentilactobacillus senioris]|uniref:hypothetical protein n=1 Tax=Lentilactobacillus senioris TaxID=931534 RepID=UPI000704C07C|nr:hypothetical protein [Lentilactobacillus senioris]
MCSEVSFHLYHGTYEENANKIREKGFDAIYFPNVGQINMGKTPKDPGSLGYGLYCFENSRENAFEFAKGFHTDSAQVIYFNFVSNNDYILDLRDSEDLKLFNEWINDDKRSRLFNELRKKYSNNGHQKSLDGAILELYIYDLVKRFKYVTKLDAVVANTHTYFNDSASKITTFPNGVEVCIRNLDGIDLESLNVYN